LEDRRENSGVPYTAPKDLPPPLSPDEAADVLAESAPFLPASATHCPAPPRRDAPPIRIPGPSIANWIWAAFSAAAGILITVGLAVHLLHPPRDADGSLRWGPYVFGAVLVASPVVMCFAIARWVLRQRREEWVWSSEGRGKVCPHCLYDVRGLDVDTCPECGETIPKFLPCETTTEVAASLGTMTEPNAGEVRR
jgi:hypothetical protein